MTPPGNPYAYPAGQLGHLSPDQLAAFDRMRRLCAEKSAYIPLTGDTEASHDDGVLLRFLRARKFDAEAAAAQFMATLAWREENGIDEIYERIDLQEYAEARMLYTQWTGRRNKIGFPLYVFDVGALDTTKVAQYEQATALKGLSRTYSTSVKMVRLFALFEHLTQLVTPWCTAAKDRPFAGTTPITQGCYIVDVGALGLRQAWSLKNHLQDSSDLATKHYPETLGTIFVVGAPSFFPTIWAGIKRWLDPVVASKVFILPQRDVLSTLSQHIEPEHIPQKYGGELEWTFGDLPNIDPALLQVVRPHETGSPVMPSGPVKWESDGEGGVVAKAYGCDEGVQRKTPCAVYDGQPHDMFYTTPLGES